MTCITSSPITYGILLSAKYAKLTLFKTENKLHINHISLSCDHKNYMNCNINSEKDECVPVKVSNGETGLLLNEQLQLKEKRCQKISHLKSLWLPSSG